MQKGDTTQHRNHRSRHIEDEKHVDDEHANKWLVFDVRRSNDIHAQRTCIRTPPGYGIFNFKCNGIHAQSNNKGIGRTIFEFDTEKHREKWQETYFSHLENMHNICNKIILNNSQFKDKLIDFDTFCNFIYYNSTGEFYE